jgi:hypothetical protein
MMSVDDGLSCSIHQLGALLATTPPFRYGLKLNKEKTNTYTSSAEDFVELLTREDIFFRNLSDSYMFVFESELLLAEIRKFLDGDEIDEAYEPVLKHLYGLQGSKNSFIRSHCKTTIVGTKAAKKVWNADPMNGDRIFEEQEDTVRVMLARHFSGIMV